MSLDKIKIQKTSQSLISHFDPEAKLEVVIKDNGCVLNIESEISGILIGRSGETLEALQHVLRLILAQETGEYFSVLLDVSGYRALRQEKLVEDALAAAKKVVETGEPIDLPEMSSYERRLVHLALQEVEGVETESMGEGSERRIVVKKK